MNFKIHFRRNLNFKEKGYILKYTDITESNNLYTYNSITYCEHNILVSFHPSYASLE